MTSDHFPIEASISMGYQLENKSAAKKFEFKKANWQLFSEIFNSQMKIYKTCLRTNIVNLIKERRKLKASLKKFWNQNWFDFIEKMGKNQLTRSNLIPNLILNEKEFKTNEEKDNASENNNQCMIQFA
ncbi:hypothetical protein BpHYR1_003285 [Brachionus plicatilis]|uniref:RNA-directed DNA polymerase from mobile element jockey-like n=1 Tax=Brachionus plicatilis TaxID=10195 RepID=A0A3M7PKY3_BRAPC|nr:hypothetical protein BpHYR1_003285 [Brachionus plicatilis]